MMNGNMVQCKCGMARLQHIPIYKYVTRSNLAHDSVPCHSASPASWLQNKEEKIDNNLQKEWQIAVILEKLPHVQYARVHTNNTAQSLFPHLLPGLINDYTVTANRLLIPYAGQRIDNHWLIRT